MPWKETTIMEQKIEFINEWRSSRFTITELCRHFDISRPTAYKWISRFKDKGLPGLAELGIEPVYSDPASPQQNGRHERMHRDLKGEATRPPGYNLRTQQRKLNKFVYEYNYVRPHKALENETPGSVHISSSRPFLEKVEEWVYPDYCEVRRVTKNGALRWRSTKWVMVATSLADKHVGLEELGDGIWRIYYRQKMLGYFSEKELRIMDELGRLKRNYV